MQAQNINNILIIIMYSKNIPSKKYLTILHHFNLIFSKNLQSGLNKISKSFKSSVNPYQILKILNLKPKGYLHFRKQIYA